MNERKALSFVWKKHKKEEEKLSSSRVVCADAFGEFNLPKCESSMENAYYYCCCNNEQWRNCSAIDILLLLCSNRYKDWVSELLWKEIKYMIRFQHAEDDWHVGYNVHIKASNVTQFSFFVNIYVT